jgi:pimeloyl-ACP methyl ester carboxylesterase
VGGAVALHLAIRHPELVRKLVVSGWSDADIQGIAAPTLITVGDLIAWGAAFVAAGDLGGGDVLLEVAAPSGPSLAGREHHLPWTCCSTVSPR